VEKDRIHVAVVDDDESFGQAIGRLLRAARLQPSVYISAEAFLDDITQAAADCLVLDIHLGGMSGLDLRRQLITLGRTTPVIFVTAHDEPKVREEAEEVGCSAYFRKPVPGRLLLEAINKAVNPGGDSK
jgi:FixJ family two-component response regulator